MLHTIRNTRALQDPDCFIFRAQFLAPSRARAVRACDTKRLQLKYLFRMVKLFQQIVHF